MKLFHYTSRSTALEHILPTGRLRFGTLPRTNDPREFAPLWFTIGGRIDDDDELTSRHPFELIEEANTLLRKSVRLLCLTEDQPSSDRSDGRYGDGPKRARMWAQYAGNHTGVCLVFNKDRLIQAADAQFKTTPGKSLFHSEVCYSAGAEHPRMPMLHQPQAEEDLRGYIESMVRENARDLFFTKDWDWSSETEYRLLLRGDTREEEFLDVRNALEAVIAGQKFHPVYKPGLWQLCEALGVESLEIQWQMGPPMIVRMIDPARRRLTDRAP